MFMSWVKNDLDGLVQNDVFLNMLGINSSL